MDINYIIKLLSFNTQFNIRFKDLIEQFSIDQIIELQRMDIISKINYERSCLKPGCLEKVDTIIEGDKYLLICANGHSTSITKTEYINNEIFHINYNILINNIFALNNLNPSFSLTNDNGLLFIKNGLNDFILVIIPGSYREDIDQYLTSYILTNDEKYIILFTDEQYKNKLDILLNLIYYKLIGYFNTLELIDITLIIGYVDKKNKVLSIEQLVDGSHFSKIFKNEQLKDLILNPQRFIERLINLSKTDNYEEFEDYVKLAIGGMVPALYNAGTKSRGLRIPDTIGFVLIENRPARILLVDAKSIQSLTKSEVKIDSGTATKYVKYLEAADELNHRTGANHPITMIFVAPQFSDNIEKLYDEIRKSYKKPFDLCFIELNALISLWIGFFNPVYRSQLINKKSFEEIIDSLFDSYKIYREFGVKTRYNSYIITIDDAKNIIKRLLESKDRHTLLYNDYLEICKEYTK